MDGFKDSTKTRYTQGGPAGVKGAAQAASAMKAFKRGGSVDATARPTDSRGRPISDEELSTPARILAKSGRADPHEVMPASHPTPQARVPVPYAKAGSAEIPDNPLQKKLNTLPSQRGEMPKRGPAGAGFNRTPYAKGGLAALPTKK